MRDAGLGNAAQYAVSMAYRVRFVMDMNAREAMHVIELRTARRGIRRIDVSASRCTR
jgi:thymidylate synthase ThyX